MSAVLLAALGALLLVAGTGGGTGNRNVPVLSGLGISMIVLSCVAWVLFRRDIPSPPIFACDA